MPAWLVILAPLADGTELVLGQTAVSPGIHDEITVEIDPLAARPNLAARLHANNEASSTFDFPEGDEPIGDGLAIAFGVDIDLPRPVFVIPEQEIGEDGILQIKTIFSPIAGWLKIHADESGRPGHVVAAIAIDEGLNEQLQFPLRWREATPQLHAVLYEDTIEPGFLNSADEDIPLSVSGEPVEEPFYVTFPPDVVVYDQPIIDGRFVVDHVLSSGASWLVVHLDTDGEPGPIIGFAPLVDGINKEIEVELSQTAVTEQLHIRLHADDDPVSSFDFPQADKPIPVANQVPAPFTLNTAPGNYLVTMDQPLPDTESDETAVIVPTTVTDIESWLVIYNSTDGERPNEMLGHIWLAPGINHNLAVTIPTAELTETLFATLHFDAPPLETFNFPDGPDVPLRRNRAIIQASFSLK